MASTGADMTTIVTGLKRAGVQAIALSTDPAQTASVASSNKALGMNVPLIGNNPVFFPALMDTPAAVALQKLFVIGSAVPFSSPVAKAKVIAKQYQTQASQPPNFRRAVRLRRRRPDLSRPRRALGARPVDPSAAGAGRGGGQLPMMVLMMAYTLGGLSLLLSS